MLKRIRSGMSFANVASGLALFIALSTGTVYAANEWTGANIVNDSLTGADIRGKGGTASTPAVNGSITTHEIAGQRANPANGTPFRPGTITQWDVLDGSLSNEDVGVLFAQVNADGTLANSSGNVSSNRITLGQYEVDFGRDITSCAFLATQGESGSGGASGAIMGVTDRGGNVEAVFATTRNNANQAVDRAFQLVVVC